MTTSDERLAQIRALCANWRASGYIDRSLARFVLGDVEWLLAAFADAEARAALLTRALYAEVRHPINVKGGWWTNEEIRDYLSAKWGLRIPPEAEPTPSAAGRKED